MISYLNCVYSTRIEFHRKSVKYQILYPIIERDLNISILALYTVEMIDALKNAIAIYFCEI